MSTTSKRFTVKPLTIAALALLAGAATFTAAHAVSRHGGPGSGPEGMLMRHHESKMEKADTNGDGAIDAAEWNALFTTIDTDKSGKLEREELMRHHGAPPPEALAFMIAHHADGDGDGKVTAAEWKAHVAELDDNGDGTLSAGELSFRHRSEETDASLPPFAKEWDANDDGSLDAGELDKLFAGADEDGDGTITFPRFERHFRR
jgi:Ca2+-binding EF-hand superfamily protein